MKELIKNSFLVELEPDDVIVLSIKDNMKSAQIEGMQKYLTECFGDRKVIIVGPTADFHILRNGDIQTYKEYIEDLEKEKEDERK